MDPYQLIWGYNLYRWPYQWVTANAVVPTLIHFVMSQDAMPRLRDAGLALIRLDSFRIQFYSFSHNHGSVETGRI